MSVESIDSVHLEVVSESKYLCFSLSSQLTFKEQVNKSIGTLASKVNALFYSKINVNRKTLLQIYNTTIILIMEYSNVIYPLISKSDCKTVPSK